MKRSILLYAACLSALCLPLLSCRSQDSPVLRLSTDLNGAYDPASGNTVEAILINQNKEGSFHVVLANVSAKPVVLLCRLDTLSFEITEADGTKLKIEAAHHPESKRVERFLRLAPGEVFVQDIYFSTAGAYAAANTYPPPGRAAWSPEFPFKKNRDKKITLQAVYEQHVGATPIKDFWDGRVLSTPQAVILSDQGH